MRLGTYTNRVSHRLPDPTQQIGRGRHPPMVVRVDDRSPGSVRMIKAVGRLSAADLCALTRRGRAGVTGSLVRSARE
jgi:hypothetical protein